MPKKVSWYAAAIAETLAEAKGYGFDIDVKGFDWPTFKTKRDKYIERLNGIYERNLKNDKVDYIVGHGRFVSKKEIEVTDSSGGKTTYGADKILIATGILFLSPPRAHQITDLKKADTRASLATSRAQSTASPPTASSSSTSSPKKSSLSVPAT